MGETMPVPPALRELLTAEAALADCVHELFRGNAWESVPGPVAAWSLCAEDYHQLRALVGAWRRAADRFAETVTTTTRGG